MSAASALYRKLNYLSLMKSFGFSLVALFVTTVSFGQFNNFYLTEQSGHGMAKKVAASIISMVDTLGYHGDLDYDYDQAETRHLINPTSEHDSKIHLSLFPNPASDFVQITAADVDLSTSTLRCLDMLGKSCPITVISKSQNNIVIDIHSLATGNYIIEMVSSKKTISNTLSIAR